MKPTPVSQGTSSKSSDARLTPVTPEPARRSSRDSIPVVRCGCGANPHQGHIEDPAGRVEEAHGCLQFRRGRRPERADIATVNATVKGEHRVYELCARRPARL